MEGNINPRKRRSRDLYFILLNSRFVFPALGGLLFGYDIGATSGATISLTVKLHTTNLWGTLFSERILFKNISFINSFYLIRQTSIFFN